MSLLALRRCLLLASRRPLGRLASSVLVLAMVLAFFQSDRMHSHPVGDDSHDHAAELADAGRGAFEWCFTNHDNPAQAADYESHAHDAGKMTSLLPSTGILRVPAAMPNDAPPPFVLLSHSSAATTPLQRPPIA